MASKNVEFRVGLLIIFALVIFGGAVIWIQEYRFQQSNFELRVIFDNVGSLSKGDPVMVAGIKKGKVKDLRLVAEGVEVTIVLSDDVKLRENAIITVKNIGLMGERFIAVDQGKADRPLDITRPMMGNYDTGIPEVMGMMGEMITELRNLVLALQKSVASDQNLEKLTSAISNLEKLSASLNDYLDRNRNNLDKTARNFLDASADLKNIIAGNRGRVDSTLGKFHDLSGKIDTIVADLEYMSKSAREFADKLNYGEGTLQMLVEDRRLYNELRVTADNLNDLIRDIRANPKKYIQLKVELF